MSVAFEPAGQIGELWDGEMAPRTVGGRRVLLVRLGDEVRAYEDRCVHLGVALSEGRLDDGVITCPAHDYQYDAGTGRGINPRAACLTRYPVKLVEGAIWVDVTAGSRDAAG